MTNLEIVQIPYAHQCPHGTGYDDCSICSGAQADFIRACYLLAEEWPEDWLQDISKGSSNG